MNFLRILHSIVISKDLILYLLFYLISIPASYFIYQKQNKKIVSAIIDDEHEDVL